MSKNSIYHSAEMVEAPLPQYQSFKKLPNACRILFIGNREPDNSPAVLKECEMTTVPNYYQANILLNHLRTESDSLPDAIMGVTSKKGARGLRDFIAFLKGNESLAGIPLIIIDYKGVLRKGPASKVVKGIDEIIHGEITADGLKMKISVLKKFKVLKQRQTLKDVLIKNNIPDARRVLYKTDGAFKRGMDIIIALVALIILSPFMLMIALLIKIDSKGPVFYKSYRAGSSYRVFKFIKFRTMVAEADHKLSKLMGQNQYASVDKNNPVFVKISNDPRITRFGKFLRNSSLDEIPQLINVLKGDMSLVGNRPLPLYEARTLTSDSTVERFNAPAGITGLWQVSKRGKKEMSVEERIALDIQYAHDYSFTQDLQIILKTPKALLQKDSV